MDRSWLNLTERLHCTYIYATYTYLYLLLVSSDRLPSISEHDMRFCVGGEQVVM